MSGWFLALSKEVIAYNQWPLEKDTVRHVVHIQHIPKSICEVKEKKKKRKKISYTAWSVYTIAVLTVLHSFILIRRWEALFTRQTTPCDSIVELLSPCKLYHTYHIMSCIYADQWQSLQSLHTPCATEPGWWKGDTLQSKNRWTEVKGRYYLFYWITGDVRKNLWRSSSQFLLLKHGELQQVA